MRFDISNLFTPTSVNKKNPLLFGNRLFQSDAGSDGGPSQT